MWHPLLLEGDSSKTPPTLSKGALVETLTQSSQDQTAARIAWLEYGAEAFKKAETENKPILLAISAVWCHWCHVQDKTTYSDPEVIRIVSRDYIPIRVDNDKRPEVNRRYNMGGWPTTAFLTPKGDVIAGGTYIPPDQMKAILREVKERHLRAKYTNKISSLEQEEKPATTEVSDEMIDYVLDSVVASFDPVHGGFGDAPKFPHADALELALGQYWYTCDEGLLTIVTKTLDRMAKGGIYDNIEGGFFRYATTRAWTNPHYEKMCEDNARLLAVYLHAYQAMRRKEYRKTATEIVHYINTTLSDQVAGGFYGSQDADEEYYKRPRSERTNVKAPDVDGTIYTNWNGLMISAYLEAAPLLDDPSLMQFALKSIDRILAESYDHNMGVMYHYLSDGKPHLRGLLIDQIAFGDALVKAYETTGDRKYLEHAQGLIRYIDGALLDTKSGGYYDSTPISDPAGHLNRPERPLDENSLASMLLMKLYHATGEKTYLVRAKSILEAQSAEYAKYGYMASTYALAVDLFLNEPTRIVIVGPLEEAGTSRLLEASLRAYDPRRLIVPLDPEIDRERLNDLGYTVEPEPRAYVCVGKTCFPPLTEPQEVLKRLSRHVRDNEGR